MKICIYEIICQSTGKKYIGQTTNFSRRKGTHLTNLRGKRHVNPKLQAAYDKYGEEDFLFIPHYYEIESQKDIDQLEIDWIAKEDSYNNGYNLTEGGQGGYRISSNKRKLSFDQYCIAYLGNKKYKNFKNKTGRWFGCDGSCISAIVEKDAYADYQARLIQLPKEEQDNYLKQFEEHFKEEITTVKPQRERLDDETAYKILCTVSAYGRGTEAAIAKVFNLSKSFVINCFRSNSYVNAVKKLKNTPEEKILEIGKQCLQEWELLKINSYLREQPHSLFEKYKKYLS